MKRCHFRVFRVRTVAHIQRRKENVVKLQDWMGDNMTQIRTGIHQNAALSKMCTRHGLYSVSTSLCKWTNKMHFLYIYLFYNFHVHSTCFEQQNRSSSGAARSVQSCVCNTVHYDQLLMMNGSIVRNM